MHAAVDFKMLGFRSGFEKAAAYDNQPGPMPGSPAPPDSHRKRNVALGAGLLIGGALGTKKLYSMGGSLAAANRQAMAKSIGDQARKAIGNPSAQSDVRRVAGKFKELNKQPISLGERGRALRTEAGRRIEGAKKGFAARYDQYKLDKAKRNVDIARHEAVNAEMRRADKNLEGYTPKEPKEKMTWAQVRRRARNTAIGAGVMGGASVAGASAASRARQSEDSSTPGA